MSTTDRIEKQILLRAPRARVWEAITDSKRFGTWFGVELDGPFVVGKEITGHVVPTKVDAEVAKMQESYKGLPVAWRVERIDPQHHFAFRWHPFAIERDVDYSAEPTTLVEFALDEVGGETKLTISESGFDQIPLERRAKAFAANEGGWAKQCELIAAYLAR
jgi:uncharacterized protein YndB with AHSA1/START domain